MQLPLFSGRTPRPGPSRARGSVGHCTSGRPLNPPLLSDPTASLPPRSPTRPRWGSAPRSPLVSRSARWPWSAPALLWRIRRWSPPSHCLCLWSLLAAGRLWSPTVPYLPPNTRFLALRHCHMRTLVQRLRL